MNEYKTKHERMKTSNYSHDNAMSSIPLYTSLQCLGRD